MVTRLVTVATIMWACLGRSLIALSSCAQANNWTGMLLRASLSIQVAALPGGKLENSSWDLGGIN